MSTTIPQERSPGYTRRERPLHGGRVTVSDGSTRMEMHKAMMKEVTLDYEQISPNCTFEERNLLAGSQLALDYAVGLFAAIYVLASRSLEPSEVTSLTRP